MPLTQLHDEKRTLTPEKVAANMRLPFAEIMKLNTIARAETLEALYERGARVKMRADQDEDITFEVGNPTSHMADARPSKFVIPGGKKPAAALPLRAAVYVAAHATDGRFGGKSIKEGKPRPDGTVPIVTIPERENFISFELVVDDD